MFRYLTVAIFYLVMLIKMKPFASKMNLVERSYSELFDGKELKRPSRIVYSGKFKSYNANIKSSARDIVMSMSREWEQVSDEIKIGLIQVLLAKVFRSRRKTVNMELYQNFIRNISRFAEANNFDPELKESFERMNKRYFYDFLEMPNLVWGKESFAKLGSYEYLTDTIIISRVLKGQGELLDFVMYHEMLHKKLNFKTTNNRNMYHTAEFRKKEKEFHDKDIEKKLQKFIRKKRLSRAFRFF